MSQAQYVGKDVVNRTVAEELARQAGIELTAVDAHRPIDFTGSMPVIVAWDSILPIQPPAMLRQLLRPSPLAPG